MESQNLQIERYKKLLDISRNLSSQRNLDELLTTITNKAGIVTGADRATLFLLSADKQELFSKVAQGLQKDYPEIRILSNVGIAGAVVTTAQTINIPDAYKDIRFNEEIDKKTNYHTKSVLCMPIINSNGTTIGVLQLLNKSGGVPFSQIDEEQLFILCMQASVAIENASHHKDLQIERYKKLLDISRSINSKINLDELLTTITKEASSIIEADRATLFLLSEDKKELWSKVAQGLPGYYSEIRIPSNAGIVGATVSTAQIINIPDAYEDSRFNKEVDKRTGYRTKSILCMPIINRNGIMIGALQLLNKLVGVFDKSDEDELSILCAQASVAIENASLYKEIEDLFEELVSTIVLSLEYRDKTTAGHTQRVALYTLKTAHTIYEKAMDRFPDASYDGDKLKRLRYACLLHDIGKIGIDENVLNKKKKLNEAQLENLLNRIDKVILLEKLRDGNNDTKIAELEDIKLFVTKHNTGQVDMMAKEDQQRMLDISKMVFIDIDGTEKPVMNGFEYMNLSIVRGTITMEEREHIKSHVLKSYEILTQVKWPHVLDELPLIAASHHEAIDGTGYPHKLKGEEIPFDGKIMAIADIYDALASADRPYKGPIPFDEVVRILRQEAERNHLDGRILEFFLAEKLYELTPEDYKRFKVSTKSVPREHN